MVIFLYYFYLDLSKNIQRMFDFNVYVQIIKHQEQQPEEDATVGSILLFNFDLGNVY